MSIEEAIQTCDLVPDEDVIRRLLVICDMLNTKICVLENQMRAQNAELARTANVASCLAAEVSDAGGPRRSNSE